MSVLVGPHKLGRALCEAWGLDPSRVASISIEIEPYRDTVLVRFLPEDGSTLSVLGRFSLTDEVPS